MDIQIQQEIDILKDRTEQQRKETAELFEKVAVVESRLKEHDLQIDALSKRVDEHGSKLEQQASRIEHLEQTVQAQTLKHLCAESKSKTEAIIRYIGHHVLNLKYHFKVLYVKKYPVGNYIDATTGEIDWESVPGIPTEEYYWNNQKTQVFVELMQDIFNITRSEEQWRNVGDALMRICDQRNTLSHNLEKPPLADLQKFAEEECAHLTDIVLSLDQIPSTHHIK
jgi:hypothetical protein